MGGSGHAQDKDSDYRLVTLSVLPGIFFIYFQPWQKVEQKENKIREIVVDNPQQGSDIPLILVEYVCMCEV